MNWVHRLSVNHTCPCPKETKVKFISGLVDANGTIPCNGSVPGTVTSNWGNAGGPRGALRDPRPWGIGIKAWLRYWGRSNDFRPKVSSIRFLTALNICE